MGRCQTASDSLSSPTFTAAATLTKKGSLAPELLDRFAGFVADYEPDMVVELGDRITDTDPEADRAALGAVCQVI